MADVLAGFFSSGRAADLALLVLAGEAVVLWLRERRTGRGPRLADVAPFLAAGACMLLALRAALVGAPWWWVAAALAGSGVAHGVDIARRLRA